MAWRSAIAACSTSSAAMSRSTSTRVLELFEQAAASSSSFCFSTTIHLDGAPRQPVFCVGESTGLEEKYAGTIIGVFIFPRFQIDLAGRRFKRQ